MFFCFVFFKSFSAGCTIQNSCRISAPCHCRTMQKYPCNHKCNKYAVCIFGKYYPASCHLGYIYDANLKDCVRGICRKYYIAKHFTDKYVKTNGSKNITHK